MPMVEGVLVSTVECQSLFGDSKNARIDTNEAKETETIAYVIVGTRLSRLGNVF